MLTSLMICNEDVNKTKIDKIVSCRD